MAIRQAMIIDDSEADQFLTLVLIEEFDSDIEVLQAYDGREALDKLNELAKPPDVIFLDINMPVMDGHEFLAKYSKQENQAPIVIMLTSSDQEKDKQRSQAYHCVKKYCGKPLGLTDLETIIQLDVSALDFPAFTRHFLVSKNNLLHTWLETHHRCDYVASLDCRTFQ